MTRSLLTASILLTITIDAGRSRWPATHWSPVPNGLVASITRQTTSTSLTLSSAVALTRLPSAVTGLWSPGVSTKTTCASWCRQDAAHSGARVVCGLSLTIDTLRPHIALTSVDLPTLGRPTSVTNPLRTQADGRFDGWRGAGRGRRGRGGGVEELFVVAVGEGLVAVGAARRLAVVAPGNGDRSA